jgi:methionyl-tRNA formyltransferase
VALRLVFMGTPDFAVPTFLEIAGSGHQVVAVYTRAPQPAGRGMALSNSPIASTAERFKIPVFTPPTLKENAAIEAMRAHGADAAVVVAFGLILPKAVLEAFPLGCFNLHASLLPRWRGAAPIQRAIIAGDRETGVMVMRIAEGLDTGPIAKTDRVPIGPDTTAGDLHDTLARLGAGSMVVALGALERGSLHLTPQSQDGVTYARKIEKNETRIDWARPAQQVHDHCRGLSPFPGAWFELSGAGRVKVLRTIIGNGSGKPGQVLDDTLTIACGDRAVRLVELQRAGRGSMPAAEFLRGTPIARGTMLQ